MLHAVIHLVKSRQLSVICFCREQVSTFHCFYQLFVRILKIYHLDYAKHWFYDICILLDHQIKIKKVALAEIFSMSVM